MPTTSGRTNFGTFGRDRKGKISLAAYLIALALAFVVPWVSVALFVTVALIWFVPDRRVERVIGG